MRLTFKVATEVTGSLFGAPWQTGRFVQFASTTSGVTATRTNTGFDNRTAMGVGMLSMVTPVRFDTLVEGQFSQRIPVTGIFTITFVPEPRIAAIYATAIAVLFTLGLRRRTVG